jgi:starch-binding outer membrane protein, SusD/RagB family
MKPYQILFLIILCSGCRKKERLNERPVSTLRTPGTLEDLQMLLENNTVFNTSPEMGDLSADNYYLPPASLQTASYIERNTYTWSKDIFMGMGGIADWINPYQQVYYSNVILKTLTTISKNTVNAAQWNTVKGAALFLRGHAFYDLAQLFTLPYDEQLAVSDPGLPLRLTDDVLEASVRSTIKETYDRILADVTEAKDLLDNDVDPLHPNRPSRPAAMALLSRIYMSMGNYDRAGAYADSCLKLYNKLLDYNILNSNSISPFRTTNPEILFYSEIKKTSILLAFVARSTIVDSTLYASYATNDLRRSLYFIFNNDGQPTIRSSYTGTIYLYSGLATDEMYLTRAECFARVGNTSAALHDLNTLLKSRYKQGTFVDTTAVNAEHALQIILCERRKELPFRNTRWTDLRRLNKDGMDIHLKRIVNDVKYELPPNDKRYALPIPPDVIIMSGMQQNPR